MNEYALGIAAFELGCGTRELLDRCNGGTFVNSDGVRCISGDLMRELSAQRDDDLAAQREAEHRAAAERNAQRVCGLAVAAADLTVVVDILGNGVVGRPAGASVRCDGGRGDPPFDDHGGTVTAVAPAVDALGSVNVGQTSLRIGAFR